MADIVEQMIGIIPTVVVAGVTLKIADKVLGNNTFNSPKKKIATKKRNSINYPKFNNPF